MMLRLTLIILLLYPMSIDAQSKQDIEFIYTYKLLERMEIPSVSNKKYKIGYMGSRDKLRIFQGLLSGKTLRGLNIDVLPCCKPQEDFKRWNIIFIDSKISKPKQLDRILAEKINIFTNRNDLGDLATITYLQVGDTVRFIINVAKARANNTIIDPKILKLAYKLTGK